MAAPVLMTPGNASGHRNSTGADATHHGNGSGTGTPQYDALQRIVFAHAGESTNGSIFAVLDGAIVDHLPERLREAGCEHSCLFSGALDPLLEAAAPHLVQLRPGHRIVEAILRDGWNDHWGIVLHVSPGTDLYALRQHLRRFLRVVGPDGSTMFFRFYDPRAFRVVIPQLDPAARRDFFGPIEGVWAEGHSPGAALYFSRSGDGRGQKLMLTRGN